MARLLLDIESPANRLTLKTMLEAEGHTVINAASELTAQEAAICDTAEKALGYVRQCPSLILAAPAEIRQAVAAMKKGVYGYIFIPLQPGEAGLMVERALTARRDASQATQPESLDSAPSDIRVQESEKKLILDTLRHCKNNQTKAAKLLGIGRNTLWRKLKRMKEEKRS